MTEDEKYVREHWLADYCGTPKLPVRIFTGPDGVTYFGNWPAAAEFTRTRLEEIRQIEEQWVLLGAQSLEWWRAMEREEAWTNRRLFWARGYVQFMFIAARLETTLADLKRGLRS